jgi:hypothetical protein
MHVPCTCPFNYLCCCQIAVNNDITDVWFFWDNHKMFADWTGVLSKLYMSSAALVTGWVGAILWRTVYANCKLSMERRQTACGCLKPVDL